MSDSNRCVLCHDSARAMFLCDDCAPWVASCATSGSVCPLCAQPSLQDAWCGHCQTHPPHFDRLWASYRLAWPLQNLLYQYKFQPQLAHARPLAAWMAQRPPPWLAEIAFDDVLAVPLSRGHLLARGFNQAQLLANGIAPLVSRTPNTAQSKLQISRRHTPSQHTLNRRQRLANVRDVFHIQGDVKGRNLLLIDDIVTTGATLNELARTLKGMGAAGVSCWVLTHA